MSTTTARPTIVELFETLKRSSLPTVLVEGKDDIIFYRALEDELQEFGVDMLPAGNKHAVLDLQRRIIENPISAPVIFIVDKDLWVHSQGSTEENTCGLITTDGYSIENDLFSDGDLKSLLSAEEKITFDRELHKFARWYALSISRQLNGETSPFRTHPGKVLDDEQFYTDEVTLKQNEPYPERLFGEIHSNHARIMRGKSLFALLLRQLSSPKRNVKFSSKQLMAVCAARKGENYQKIHTSIRNSLEKLYGHI